MRVSMALFAAGTIFCGAIVVADETSSERALVRKIELLGAKVERDVTLPDQPVVKFLVNGSKRFNERHLHLLTGFSRLRSVDLGEMRLTDSVIDKFESPVILADLLLEADPSPFKKILDKLVPSREVAIAVWQSELNLEPLSDKIPSAAPERERRGIRQANAAMALLRCGVTDPVWPLLRHSPDPRARTNLIHRLARYGGDAKLLFDRLKIEPDVSIRRALLLGLGEFEDYWLQEDNKRELLAVVETMYTNDSDPGVHAAAELLIARWGRRNWLKNFREQQSLKEVSLQKLNLAEATIDSEGPSAPLRWYVNSQGQTMVVIPGSVTFTMGSPVTEAGRTDDERPHQRRIGRSFAIANKPVTVEEFQRFRKDHLNNENDQDDDPGRFPVTHINWRLGARYCNWLSEQEQLDPCYEIQDYEVSLTNDYLSRTGYRFPTEAEMEYATRAGTITSRYYGESDTLLIHYAWHIRTSQGSAKCVGQLKPNDFGLFDTLGNISVWCQDRYDLYPNVAGPVDDVEGALSISDRTVRVMRGSGAASIPDLVRSAHRGTGRPSFGNPRLGIRLARTIRLAPSAGEK